MKLQFWGATDDVTGSMTFLQLETGTILIDCGLAQGTAETEKINHLPLPISAKEIHTVIITHAHLDHSGFLPRLVKKGFKGRIHCTPATAKLMRIILLDSAKLNEDNFYDEKDVQSTLELVKTHEWAEPFDLLDSQFTFLPAGHILGASSLLIQAQGKRMVFSGDLGRSDDPILPSYPACPKADTIIMESTYGGKKRAGNLHKELQSFLMTVGRESRVGIIASFAVARAQTLITLIHEFYERYPKEKVRVVIDSPMMKEANKVYQQYSHLTLHKKSLYTSLDEIDAIEYKKEWDSLRKKTGPLVIISSSGMLTGGRIARHLYNWREDKKAILFLPGYQAEGTPGKTLVEGNRSLMAPNGEQFEWQGEVWSSEAFSSHADQDELLNWATQNNSKAEIFLLHGEENSKKALQLSMAEKGEFNIHIPLRGEIF